MYADKELLLNKRTEIMQKTQERPFAEKQVKLAIFLKKQKQLKPLLGPPKNILSKIEQKYFNQQAVKQVIFPQCFWRLETDNIWSHETNGKADLRTRSGIASRVSLLTPLLQYQFK